MSNQSVNIQIKTETPGAKNVAQLERTFGNLAKSEEVLKKQTKKLYTETDKQAKSFASMRQQAIPLAGAMKGLFAAATAYKIAEFSKGIFQLEKGIRATEKAYIQITGSEAAAAKEMEYLRQVAEKTGQNFYNLTDSYKGLMAASRDTVLEGQKTRDIFQAVTKASASLGLSSEQTQGALYALSQMISKGNVQAEELRGQLGERLPGAFNLAAEAMGVSTQELNKMLEQGQVLASDMLPKLAAVLESKYSGEVDASVRATNKLAEAWTDLKREFANSGFMDSISVAIRDLTKSFQDESVKASMREFGQNIGAIVENLVPLVTAVAKFGMEWGKTILVVAGVTKAISLLTSTITGLNAAMGMLKLEGVSNNFFKIEKGAIAATSATKALGSATLVLAAALAAIKVGEAAVAFWDMRDAQEAAAKASRNLIERSGELLEKFAEFKDIKIPEDFAGKSVEQLEALKEQINGAYAAQMALVASLREQAKETNIFGNLTDGAEKAKEQLVGAEDRLRDIMSAMRGVSSEVDIIAAKNGKFVESTKWASDILSNSLKSLGLNMEGVAKKTQDAEEKAIHAFTLIRTSADATASQIMGAFEAVNKQVKTVDGLQALRAQLVTLGNTGKVSADKIAEALSKVDNELRDIADNTDPVIQAMEELGIISTESLDNAAEKARQNFEIIRKSGVATAHDIKAAWEAYSDKAVAAAKAHGDSEEYAITKTLEAEEAALGLADALESSGDAGAQAGEKITSGMSKVVQSAQKAASEVRKVASSADSASDYGKGKAEYGKKSSKSDDGKMSGRKIFVSEDEATSAMYDLSTGAVFQQFTSGLFEDFEALRSRMIKGEEVTTAELNAMIARIESANTKAEKYWSSLGTSAEGAYSLPVEIRNALNEMTRLAKAQGQGSTTTTTAPTTTATKTESIVKKVLITLKLANQQDSVSGVYDDSDVDKILNILQQAGLTAV